MYLCYVLNMCLESLDVVLYGVIMKVLNKLLYHKVLSWCEHVRVSIT